MEAGESGSALLIQADQIKFCGLRGGMFIKLLKNVKSLPESYLKEILLSL